MAHPVVGILTGVSYVSGVDYYKNVNEQFGKLVGIRHVIKPNPLMVLVSVDCDVYAKLLCERDFAAVYAHLARGVDRLVAGGADFLVIASNTAHMALPAVRARHPALPVLHIADATAREIAARGLARVGLLGTEPTMREDYLKV